MSKTVNNFSIALFMIGIFLIGISYVLPTVTGMVTGTATVNVANVTTISMTVSTVAFDSMALGESNDTTDDSPPPFVVQNDGNVHLNITIGAEDLWTSDANPTNNFQSMCGDTGEWSCASGSNTSFAAIPVTGSPGRIIAYLPWADAEDTAQIEINVTVPSAEGGGSKSSTVTFLASHAYVS